eukprot:GILJ01013217.1.p1 GENE.GILJ01013217.1~~GILJ01013217.1.p1  ORF type:complete len:408 (+),score=17.66 GILJ01013217.1:32-1225(+)
MDAVDPPLIPNGDRALQGSNDFVCWKCSGTGLKFVKETERNKRRKQVDDETGQAVQCPKIPCGVCKGKGFLSHERNRARPGEIRQLKAPQDWTFSGPSATGDPNDPIWQPAQGEVLCYLTGNWRIYQKVDGHRYSTDDLCTAWYAIQQVLNLQRHSEYRLARHLDIGCGLGSVLMMVAWKFTHLTNVGLEAQSLSVELARRSIKFNGCDNRVTVRHGDLSDPQNVPEGPVFDLVTGTPPYFPVDKTDALTLPLLMERGLCAFEFRGGIETYCHAAKQYLAPHGRFIVCQTALEIKRSELAIDLAGLEITSRLDVIGKEGKPALFVVFSTKHRVDSASTFSSGLLSAPTHDAVASFVLPYTYPVETIVVRDSEGNRTSSYMRVMEDMGKPVMHKSNEA